MRIRCRILPTGYREGAGLIQVELPGELQGVVTSSWNGPKRILYTPLDDHIAFVGVGSRRSDFAEQHPHPLATDNWKRAFPGGIDARVVAAIARAGLQPVRISTVLCSRWSDGRLVLIGDAAHAMPPNRGQGAAISMQDGVTLARYIGALRGRADQALAPALSRWEAQTRPVVRGTQLGAVVFCFTQAWWPRPALALRPGFYRSWTKTQRPDLRLTLVPPRRPDEPVIQDLEIYRDCDRLR
jgi:2-polyprenyl-6-methoxyphenol hydroxylase-like FAD-dependent oxidoreductase